MGSKFPGFISGNIINAFFWDNIIILLILDLKSSILVNIRNFSGLEKIKITLDLITDIDMLLMVEKGITGGIFHCIDKYAKDNNKYMKDFDKIINCYIFNIGM